MTERALVANAADPRQVRDARRKKSHLDKQEQADWEALLANAPFRRRIWALLQQCGVYQANEETTEYGRGRKEGKRQIGLMLIDKLLTADPESYVALLVEHARARKQDAVLPEPSVTPDADDVESDDAEAGADPGAHAP